MLSIESALQCIRTYYTCWFSINQDVSRLFWNKCVGMFECRIHVSFAVNMEDYICWLCFHSNHVAYRGVSLHLFVCVATCFSCFITVPLSFILSYWSCCVASLRTHSSIMWCYSSACRSFASFMVNRIVEIFFSFKPLSQICSLLWFTVEGASQWRFSWWRFHSEAMLAVCFFCFLFNRVVFICH